MRKQAKPTPAPLINGDNYTPPAAEHRAIPHVQPTLKNAAALVLDKGICYASLFTTHMSIGYAEAVGLMDELARQGVICPDEGLRYHGCAYRRLNVQRAPASKGGR